MLCSMPGEISSGSDVLQGLNRSDGIMGNKIRHATISGLADKKKKKNMSRPGGQQRPGIYKNAKKEGLGDSVHATRMISVTAVHV